MSRSWELTPEQKKEFDEQSGKVRAEYDQETGEKKGAGSTGETEDTESMDSDMDRGSSRDERPVDDDNVR